MRYGILLFFLIVMIASTVLAAEAEDAAMRQNLDLSVGFGWGLPQGKFHDQTEVGLGFVANVSYWFLNRVALGVEAQWSDFLPPQGLAVPPDWIVSHYAGCAKVLLAEWVNSMAPVLAYENVYLKAVAGSYRLHMSVDSPPTGWPSGIPTEISRSAFGFALGLGTQGRSNKGLAFLRRAGLCCEVLYHYMPVDDPDGLFIPKGVSSVEFVELSLSFVASIGSR